MAHYNTAVLSVFHVSRLVFILYSLVKVLIKAFVVPFSCRTMQSTNSSLNLSTLAQHPLNNYSSLSQAQFSFQNNQ